MTDLTIDHLAAGTTPSGVEPLPTVQSGADAYLTVTQISTFAGAALKSGTNSWTGVNTFTLQTLLSLGSTAIVTPLSITGIINNYFEINNQNTSSGTGASADFVATADTGTSSAQYIDLGINSSGYTGGVFGSALEGYLYTSDNNLNIGTATAAKVVRILAGGSSVGSNTVATFASTGVTLTALTVGSLAGLLKATAGVISAATAGTDYLTPTGSGAGLTSLNASNLSSGTVPAAQMPALTGDVTTTAGAVATTLASVITAAGPIGSTSVVPVITYDAKGRLTTVTTATITPAAIGALPASGGTTNYLALWSSATALTSSQYLPAANHPALTGDVTTVAGALAATIAANAVTYAKFQQVAASSLVGNATGSLANATGITLGATLAFSGSALQTAAHTGDITTAANSFATTIATGAVTDTKSSVTWKPTTKVVATTNQAITGLFTVDGYTLVAGDIALLTGQTTASQNGPWVAASGAWARPTWWPSAGTLQAFYGAQFIVTTGTANGGSEWYVSTTGAITIDTTSVTITKMAYGTFTATSLVATTTTFNGAALTWPASNAAGVLLNAGTGALSWAMAATRVYGGVGASTAVTAASATTFAWGTSTGSLVIPAAFWSVGHAVRIRAFVSFTAGTSAATTTLTFNFGGTSITLTSASFTSQTAGGWLDIVAVCATTGAGGTANVSMSFDHGVTAATQTTVFSTGSTVALNTTTTQTVTLQGQVSTTTGAPSVTMYNPVVETIY